MVLFKEILPLVPFFHNGFCHITACPLPVFFFSEMLLTSAFYCLLLCSASSSTTSFSLWSSTISSIDAPQMCRPVLLPMDKLSSITCASDPSKSCSLTYSGYNFFRLSLRSRTWHPPRLCQQSQCNGRPWNVCSKTFRDKVISLVTLKHLLKSTFVYSFLKFQITCCSTRCTGGSTLIWRRYDLYEVVLSVQIFHQG